MSKLFIKLSQVDPRVMRFALFVLGGILAPIIIQTCPGMPGGISG